MSVAEEEAVADDKAVGGDPGDAASVTGPVNSASSPPSSSRDVQWRAAVVRARVHVTARSQKLLQAFVTATEGSCLQCRRAVVPPGCQRL